MEYLKEYKIVLPNGNGSTFHLAYNVKEAKAYAREWAGDQKRGLFVRCMGVAIDPQTGKRVSRPKNYA